MKLQEIIAIPQMDQHKIKDMSIFNNAVQFKHACVEKYPLLYTEASNSYHFCIEDNGTKIAFIIAEKNTFAEQPCIIIQRTWVETKYRNLGFMKAMYNTLHNQGFVVLSDISLTPESLSIWKALAHRDLARIIDTNTEEIRKIEPEDYTIQNNHTRFILEANKSRFVTNSLDYLLYEHEYYINNRYKELFKKE